MFIFNSEWLWARPQSFNCRETSRLVRWKFAVVATCVRSSFARAAAWNASWWALKNSTHCCGDGVARSRARNARRCTMQRPMCSHGRNASASISFRQMGSLLDGIDRRCGPVATAGVCFLSGKADQDGGRFCDWLSTPSDATFMNGSAPKG